MSISIVCPTVNPSSAEVTVTASISTLKVMFPPPVSLEEVRCLFQQLLASNHDDPNSHAHPVFISLDISHGNPKRFSAIGASTLDTRSLTTSHFSTPMHHTHPPLHTETFDFRYGRVGVNRNQLRALFHGQVNQVRWSERAAVINHIFSHCVNGDREPCCNARKLPLYDSSKVNDSNEQRLPIILVGHDIPSDLLSLNKAGISINDVATVTAIIDTQKLAREMYKADDPGWNVSLRTLCRLVGMIPTKLHDCGNDAAWTLLVLFSLAAKLISEDDEGREILEEVVREGTRDSKTRKQRDKGSRVRNKEDQGDWADNLVVEVP